MLKLFSLSFVKGEHPITFPDHISFWLLFRRLLLVQDDSTEPSVENRLHTRIFTRTRHLGRGPDSASVKFQCPPNSGVAGELVLSGGAPRDLLYSLPLYTAC